MRFPVRSTLFEFSIRELSLNCLPMLISIILRSGICRNRSKRNNFSLLVARASLTRPHHPFTGVPFLAGRNYGVNPNAPRDVIEGYVREIEALPNADQSPE